MSISKSLLMFICIFTTTQSIQAQTWQYPTPNTYYMGGNVGIGTQSPQYALHLISQGNAGTVSSLLHGQYYGTQISTEASSSSYYAFNIVTGSNNAGGGGTSRFYVRADGNIGIGTESPTLQLDVIGSPIFQSANMNASVRMKPSSASFNGGNQVVYFSENYDIANSAVGVIGLANTNWTAPLPSFAVVSTRNGTGSAKDMMFWANDNPSGSNVALTIKANTGNIGIGTLNPQGTNLL